jgi:ureidoacrylate peracid hydrolase
MSDVTYNKDITGLVVIDPYNDYISDGAKYGIA